MSTCEMSSMSSNHLVCKGWVAATKSVPNAAVGIEDKGGNVEHKDDPSPRGGAGGAGPSGAGLQPVPKCHVNGYGLPPFLFIFGRDCLLLCWALAC